MQTFLMKLEGVWDILRYFGNPLVVIALRLGFLRVPLFLYRLAPTTGCYSMLARPTSNTMADLFVLREVFVTETYRDILPLLPKGPVRCVDVGGNIGSFSVWLKTRQGIKEGFCFEPDPTSYNLCRYNLTNNGCGMVQLIPKAVGGQARQITMRVNTNRPGGNNIYVAAKEGEEVATVEVLPFADWMRTQPGEFDLLKLDCEGAEWEILDRTPPEVFQRFRVIVAEIHTDPDGKHAHQDFADQLARLGFKTVRWDGKEHGLYVGHRVSG